MAECERCDGDGWVEVFGDEGFPVGARDCEKCGGTGKQRFYFCQLCGEDTESGCWECNT